VISGIGAMLAIVTIMISYLVCRSMSLSRWLQATLARQRFLKDRGSSEFRRQRQTREIRKKSASVRRDSTVKANASDGVYATK
jgi:hypothetical protein